VLCSLLLAAALQLAPLSNAGDRGAAGEPLALGAPAPTFVFTDTRWLPRTLEDFGAASATVIVFTTLDCPVANRVLPAVGELERRYRARGVRFLALDVGARDTLVEVARRALDQGLEFPVGRDFDGSAVRALGATRTPEVLVFDGRRRLAYRGRVDAQARLTGTQPGAVRADLAEALEDVLAERAVRVPTTPVDGCRITPPATAAERAGAGPPPSWNEAVADVVFARCTPCHAAGGDAPFALETYEQARAQAAMLAEVVEQGRMPPWFAAPSETHWLDQRTLSPIERAALLAWAQGGTPLGDGPPLSAPPRPPESWRIGEPDLVLAMPQEVELPASGTIPYRYVVLPHVFAHDTWVEAVEIRPANRRAVHHANLAWVQLDKPFRTENFVTGHVPGGAAMELGAGTALCLPAGALLGLQIHYVPTGRPERDRIAVGLRFPRGVVERRLRHKAITDTRFTIAPEAPAQRVEAAWTLDVDAEGVGLFAHMHLRGRDMRFEALGPDGVRRELLCVPNYSFDWQTAYAWPPGTERFAAGTRIEVRAHFDNSRFNPFNPDPGRAVTFGEDTTDEMMYGFFFYVARDERLGLAIDPRSGAVRAR